MAAAQLVGQWIVSPSIAYSGPVSHIVLLPWPNGLRQQPSKRQNVRSIRAGSFMVAVVQMVRAPDCGSGDRGFESHRLPFMSA